MCFLEEFFFGFFINFADIFVHPAIVSRIMVFILLSQSISVHVTSIISTSWFCSMELFITAYLYAYFWALCSKLYAAIIGARLGDSCWKVVAYIWFNSGYFFSTARDIIISSWLARSGSILVGVEYVLKSLVKFVITLSQYF